MSARSLQFSWGDFVKTTFSALTLSLVLAAGASAQQASRTQPVEGMRDNGTGYHALVGARARAQEPTPRRTDDVYHHYFMARESNPDPASVTATGHRGRVLDPVLRLTTLLTTATPPQCSPTTHGLLGVHHHGDPQQNNTR